jgi:predicted glycosyltransferase
MQMLIPMVRDFKPGVAVSVASTDCARVSFGIRIKHIAVNDSPHSIVAAKLSIPFSHHLFTPWIIPFSAWTRFGIERRDITRYKALDPAAWLKREELDTSSSLDLDRSRPTIVVRLEETYASYMIGKNPLWTGKVLERLRRLEDANVVVLCRYKDQLDEIRAKFGNHFIVPDVVNGAALLRLSDVFIGMGGTMTTEAALIGIPTISMFQGEGLYTEKYLISKDLLMKTHNLDELARFVEKSLDPDYKKAIAKKARILLDSMEDPAKVIADYLMKLRISN